VSLLHTVNKSPFERDSLASCLRLARPGAAILLIEDGVYAAVRGTVHEPRTREALDRFSLYVLGPDLEARGMEDERLIEGVRVVDYAGFVELAIKHDNVQAWL
jgi:tRNA 2-thiouridine synthesizing protein B